MNIYIGGPIIISDMQGPAPDGFHVPLNTEWQAIYDAGASLGAWGSEGSANLSTYLKMPVAAGYREHSSNVYGVGSFGRYWSSSPTNLYYTAYSFNFNYSSISPGSTDNRNQGFSIRCMKNTPITPTDSWTKLYGTSIESGGIFWNSSDGLISISSNGSTWYTLMDKNLGATTVYNYGDTLTDANCGYFYQWGNNYGFPHSGSVATSSTRVDASRYGPGNYYESSTFITTNPWDSPQNDNLRGGVSQLTSTKSVEVQKIYIGDKLTYIGYISGLNGNVEGSLIRGIWSKIDSSLSGYIDINTPGTYLFKIPNISLGGNAASYLSNLKLGIGMQNNPDPVYTTREYGDFSEGDMELEIPTTGRYYLKIYNSYSYNLQSFATFSNVEVYMK